MILLYFLACNVVRLYLLYVTLRISLGNVTTITNIRLFFLEKCLRKLE
nr:MAG TPA: hypothetical protein [Caudoviricetes sp.]